MDTSVLFQSIIPSKDEVITISKLEDMLVFSSPWWEVLARTREGFLGTGVWRDYAHEFTPPADNHVACLFSPSEMEKALRGLLIVLDSHEKKTVSFEPKARESDYCDLSLKVVDEYGQSSEQNITVQLKSGTELPIGVVFDINYLLDFCKLEKKVFEVGLKMRSSGADQHPAVFRAKNFTYFLMPCAKGC